MKLYIDTENGKIITEDDLRIEFDGLKAQSPEEYPYSFAAYVRNCTDKNGTLEEVSVDPSVYVGYEIHECAQRPTDTGRYVGRTPVLAQALEACLRAKEHGGSYFIYGIKKDGTKVLFL